MEVVQAWAGRPQLGGLVGFSGRMLGLPIATGTQGGSTDGSSTDGGKGSTAGGNDYASGGRRNWWTCIDESVNCRCYAGGQVQLVQVMLFSLPSATGPGHAVLSRGCELRA